MNTRLRRWARTGEYSEEPQGKLDRRDGKASRRVGWLERLPAAALVPLGILVGTLLALAFVVRLLALPFTLLSGPARGRKP